VAARILKNLHFWGSSIGCSPVTSTFTPLRIFIPELVR
jgi:hypothetical protein